MANFAGSVFTPYYVDDTLSRTVGQRTMNGEYASIAVLVSPLDVDNYQPGGAAPPAPPLADYQASIMREATPGFDWFGKVHIIPRSKIEFGNIITTETEEFEIFNAFDQDVSFQSFTNNAGDGLTIPDLPSLPSTLYKFSSFLDPSSTRLNPILPVIEVSPDGVATFDTSLEFTFSPGGTILLFVSGSRIILIPFRYEVDVKETLAHKTDIIEANNGKEQRIALRKNPRQLLDVLYKLETVERQRLHAMLFDWTDNEFGLPLWVEELRITAATSPGATQFQVSGADDVDLRVGGLAALITDSLTFDVIQIQAKTDTLITAEDPAINGYAAGTPLVPVRVAVVAGAIPTARSLVTLEQFRIRYEVTDNDTGALTGSTTPGFWSTYNSRVLFSDCNVMEREIQTELVRKIYRIDNEIGKIDISSSWDRNKRSGTKGFLLRDRAEIMQLRRLWIALRGMQKAFYIPTKIEELFAADDLDIGTDTMDITHIGYVRFAQDGIPMSILRVNFTDGTFLERVVLSSAGVSATVERLTLHTTWPANRTIDEIERIEFYELARSASDSMTLAYSRVGQAQTVIPWVRVFDDD